MPGLRDSKKRRTREAIAQAAADLFLERGFAAVTVDDVARAADVSRQTVFNYFPTKEQMLFDRQDEIGAALLSLVRDRPDGASLVAAFRGHTREFWERFGRILRDGGETHGFWEIVQSSPALRDYAESSFGREARAVGEELAREWNRPPDDPICHALARALCGVNIAVFTCGLGRLTAGDDHETVVVDMIAQADQAYDLLEHGLERSTPGWAKGASLRPWASSTSPALITTSRAAPFYPRRGRTVGRHRSGAARWLAPRVGPQAEDEWPGPARS